MENEESGYKALRPAWFVSPFLESAPSRPATHFTLSPPFSLQTALSQKMALFSFSQGVRLTVLHP